MSINYRADQDFERAARRGFWRKILTRLTGASNDLLPFDEVRERLPVRGQHYLGFRQVPIKNIVGSQGRYRDFDRVFLPLQRKTKSRWVNIDKAHYEDINLPPVDLYKVADVYFVKDGNHRVSVARERGQEYIDAYVIEIDIPVQLSPDIRLDDLVLKEEYANFLINTRLNEIRPEANLEMTVPGLYDELLHHIETHRWYLGEKRGAEVTMEESAASFYDNVYLPVVVAIRGQDFLKEFPDSSEAEIFLWIMEYYGHLSQAYKEEDVAEVAEAIAAKQLVAEHPRPTVKKVIQMVDRTNCPVEVILRQEQADFLKTSRLKEIRPEVQIETTLPGQYEQLREHIAVHRWYLGEQRMQEIPYEEAVASWYDNVYLPLVEIIEEQNILAEFPNRTVTDLYLWIIRHQWQLRETYGEDISMEEAAEEFVEEHSNGSTGKAERSSKRIGG